MALTTKEIKKRYFDKKYAEAAIIECACGCGGMIKELDRYARPQKFISGHNRQKYEITKDASKAAKKRWKENNPDWIREDKNARYRRLKLLAMDLKNNKCNHCGIEYNGKNSPIFEFHHSDPTIKERGITRMLTNASWDRVLAELEKCELVCANCHNQFHGGKW